MAQRRVMIPLHCDIDRCLDAAGVASIYLLFEQVARKMRVPAFRIFFGIVIDPAMVPARKNIDRIDMRFDQRVGEFVGVKVCANALDKSAGVEIEMDLPER